MRPGPRPKPTALKLLEGSRIRQPSAAKEPKPPLKVPPCPPQLSPDAKKVYRKLGRQFATLGVIAEVDEAALAILSESFAAWLTLVEQARELGAIVKVNGQPMANPLLTRADREAEKVRKLLAEFGGTPAARARVAAEGSALPSDADDITQFLRRASAPRMRIVQ